MKRFGLTAGLTLLVLSCCIGCGQEVYARRIISPVYNPGRTDLSLGWVPADLIRNGRIDRHEVIEAPDKVQLDVWVINARDAAKKRIKASGTVVILHSYMYGKASYPCMGVGERLAKKGYDVVLMDLRRHGRSGGEFTTFGVKEKEDLKLVIDRLADLGAIHSDVYVFGVNLGAMVGIQYAAIDERCKGVVAVSPYQDFRHASRMWVGPALLNNEEFNKMIETCGKMGQFDPDAASAVEAAKKLTCPLLVIHGLLDFSVPIEHSRAIYESAGGPKKLVTMIGPEAIVLEDWLVGRIDSLITKGLEKPNPTTQPASN